MYYCISSLVSGYCSNIHYKIILQKIKLAVRIRFKIGKDIGLYKFYVIGFKDTENREECNILCSREVTPIPLVC